MPHREAQYQKDARFRHISSCLRVPKFQIFLGEHAPQTSLVCSCFTIQFTHKTGYKQDYRQIASPLIRI